MEKKLENWKLSSRFNNTQHIKTSWKNFQENQIFLKAKNINKEAIRVWDHKTSVIDAISDTLNGIFNHNETIETHHQEHLLISTKYLTL